MDLIFYFALTEKGSRFPRPIYKRYNNVTVIPRIGEQVQETLRTETHEVVDVEYDYKRNICFVYLKPEEITYSFDEYVKMANMHEWVRSLSEIDYM